MKTKSIVTYATILLFGLLLGWFFFGTSSDEVTTHNHDGAAEEATQLWTCSMHPQIMQPEPGDCPICGMELIPAEAGADGLAPGQFRLTENAMALANIQTTRVGNPSDEKGTITLSGILEPNEESQAVQVSYFNGRIENLNVTYTGATVNKGQRLATLYSPELYATQQELITAAGLKESQPKLYQAVRNKLKLWKISEAQIEQIETTGKPIENFPVYATVSGTVTKKLVEVGDYVKQGQPLFEIANLNKLWAQFDVYENTISQLKQGQAIVLTTNAFPGREFEGTVEFIDPMINTNTRTAKLRVSVANAKGDLKPGMFVEGQLEGTGSGKEVLMIPASAVLWTGKRSLVYVKPNADQPIFELREVSLGTKNKDAYEILKGLESGEEIVTNGTFTVDAAAQLQGKPSMMNAKNENTMEGMQMERKTISRVETPKEFQNKLEEIVQLYLSLKDALVASNSENANQKANELLERLTAMDATLLQSSKNKAQWKSDKVALLNPVQSFNTALDLETQRLAFKKMALPLLTVVERYGAGETLYYQFCPMADNYTGGFWISAEKEIKNPYYGNAMLRCGEVKKVID